MEQEIFRFNIYSISRPIRFWGWMPRKQEFNLLVKRQNSAIIKLRYLWKAGMNRLFVYQMEDDSHLM